VNQKKAKEYWKENVFLIIKLLIIWFVISFGCGILFVEQLNLIEINGVKLGFFMAQQGAIYLFIILIIIYIKKMSQIDKKYDISE
jgi:putative solute:sodium symporter small subunit